MIDVVVLIVLTGVDCVEGRVVESVPLLDSIDIEAEGEEVDEVITGGL